MLCALYGVAILSVFVRVFNPHAAQPPDWMIFVLYGIAFNGIAFTILTFIKERRDKKKEEKDGFSY